MMNFIWLFTDCVNANVKVRIKQYGEIANVLNCDRRQTDGVTIVFVVFGFIYIILFFIYFVVKSINSISNIYYF